jgi:hypothetical protein
VLRFLKFQDNINSVKNEVVEIVENDQRKRKLLSMLCLSRVVYRVKILLYYIRKFLRKKNKIGKKKFITNKNKSKNQVGKSNSQMLLSISFVCVICFSGNRLKNNIFLLIYAQEN